MGLTPLPSSRGTCFVVSSLRAGGAERVIARLASDRAEIERTVLITLDSTATDFYKPSSKLERVALSMLEPSRSRLHGFAANVGRARSLRRALADSKCDIVVSFVDATNILTLIATYRLGLSVIVSERINPRQINLGWPWRLARRVTYKWASKLVVQTKAVADWGRALMPPERIVIIPNGVEPSRNQNLERQPMIVAAGRLVPQKGFDLLLKAFALVTTKHPDWRVVILGEGPERANLETLARQLNLGGKVVMPGTVPDIAKYLEEASIFVLSSRFEGFPNVLLEAMASGCAVVATDCPSGPADIVRPGIDGLLVPAGDAREISEAVGILMANANLREEMGNAARHVSERFSIEAELFVWDQVISSLRSCEQ
jgi:GalNAc-alpha-(1->4)-GalNAc-alpha-(1->3)-diNAcBac-PP-undecaprenol alpha-1,4-N-acetyl-D-galactosaminyltransferase